MTNDEPLVIAITALISAVAAWVGNGIRIKRKSDTSSSVEQLVTDAVTRQYHQLVAEVAQLRAEVSALRSDVTDRDKRIDELEADKALAAARVADLEREVTELRAELENYRPARKRAPKPPASE